MESQTVSPKLPNPTSTSATPNGNGDIPQRLVNARSRNSAASQTLYPKPYTLNPILDPQLEALLNPESLLP